jgi:hypothetical protein
MRAARPLDQIEVVRRDGDILRDRADGLDRLRGGAVAAGARAPPGVVLQRCS